MKIKTFPEGKKCAQDGPARTRTQVSRLPAQIWSLHKAKELDTEGEVHWSVSYNGWAPSLPWPVTLLPREMSSPAATPTSVSLCLLLGRLGGGVGVGEAGERWCHAVLGAEEEGGLSHSFPLPPTPSVGPQLHANASRQNSEGFPCQVMNRKNKLTPYCMPCIPDIPQMISFVGDWPDS